MIHYISKHSAFALSPSGSFLGLVRTDRNLEIINLLSGQADIKNFGLAENSDLDFIDDNKILYVNSDNTLISFDLDGEVGAGIYSGIESPGPIKSGNQFHAVADGKRVLVIDLEGQVKFELKGCRSTIRALCFSHCGNKLFATGDKKLHMWDLTVKKPKSSPIATLETNGTKLAISKDDSLICISEVGKYNWSQIHVYNLESGDRVFHSKEDNFKFAVNAGCFLEDQFVVKCAGKTVFVDTMKWSINSIIEDSWGCCILEKAGVLAISSHEKVDILNPTGEIDLFSTPLNNLAPVKKILPIGDYLYSISSIDLVKRKPSGEAVDGDKRYFSRGIRDVVTTAIDELVWVMMGANANKAALLDVDAEEEVIFTKEFNNFVSATFTTKDNRTIFASSSTMGNFKNGGIAKYSIDGKLEYKVDKLPLYDVLVVWEQNDGLVQLLGKYFRNSFDPKKKAFGVQTKNENLYSFAHVDQENERIYLLEDKEGESVFKIINIDFSDEATTTKTKNIDGYDIVGWYEKGKNLVLKSETADLTLLDCESLELTQTAINEPRATCCSVVDNELLMIGLDNGSVCVKRIVDPQ